MQSTYYEFREAANINELRELLRLRHRIYRDSRLACLAKESGAEFDLDAFDLRSMHFGLFKLENGMSIPVGYHRIVQERFGAMQRDILRLAEEMPGLPEKLSETPPTEFPIETYYSEPQAIASLCSRFHSNHESVIEATKFAIDKTERSLVLAKHVIESESAIHLFCRNTPHVMMAVTTFHSRFYRQYGFEQIEGTADFNFENLQGRCLIASPSSVPASIRPKLMRMAEAYAKHRKVCFNPSDPNNFHAPVVPENLTPMSLAA